MKPPKVGEVVRVEGLPMLVRVLVLRPFGTMDVQAIDGTERCWRVSGLGWLKP